MDELARAPMLHAVLQTWLYRSLYQNVSTSSQAVCHWCCCITSFACSWCHKRHRYGRIWQAFYTFFSNHSLIGGSPRVLDRAGVRVLVVILMEIFMLGSRCQSNFFKMTGLISRNGLSKHISSPFLLSRTFTGTGGRHAFDLVGPRNRHTSILPCCRCCVVNCYSYDCSCIHSHHRPTTV